jgi:hypothetical protein
VNVENRWSRTMPFVLNEAQLRRIENVHSGFL